MMNPEDEEEVLLEHFAKTNGGTYSESDSEDENVLYDQTTVVPEGTTRNSKRYRHSSSRRVVKTMLICMAFCCLGLCIALPGPTLLDLQERTNTDTETISRLFTGRSIGYLIGSIIGGVLFDRVKNHSCLMACSLFMVAIFNAAAPWSREILLLISILAAEGFFLGFLDTGGNTVCIQIWGRKSAPYMQALHFSFGLGAFVAPLIAEPFLSDQLVNVTSHNSTPTFHPPIPALHHIHRRDVLADAPPTANHSNISLPDVKKKPTKTNGDLLSKNKDSAAGHNVKSGFVKKVIEKQKEVERKLNTPAPTTTLNPNITQPNSTVSNITTTTPLPTTTTTVAPTTTTTTTTTPVPTTTTTTVATTTPEIHTTMMVAIATNKSDLANNESSYWVNLTHAFEEQIEHVVYDISHQLTTIQFAYLIVSMVMVMVAIAFCGDCCYSCCRKQLKFTKPSRLKLVRNPGVGFNFQLMSLLFLFFFLYVGMEVTYGGLLFSFVVEQAHWEKSMGTYVTSVFWGSFALTRGCSILISKYLKPGTMLICDLILTVAALLLLLTTTDQYYITLWIGTATLGVGMASIFPSGLSWAELYINVTGKVASVFITASSLGEMLLPALCGFLFEKKSPMFLIYILFAASLVCVVVYILMQNLAFNRGEKYHLFSRIRNSDRGVEMEEIALTAVTDIQDRSHTNGTLVSSDGENGHSHNGHLNNGKRVTFVD